MCKRDTALLSKHVLEEPLSGLNRSIQDIYWALPPAHERIPVESKQLRSDEASAAEQFLDDAYHVCEGVHVHQTP
jgi:hypothetical protein